MPLLAADPFMRNMKENKRVAVFIDAENISAKYADKLLAETSNYGDVIIRRIFADWSSQNVKEWQEQVNRHSLLAEQQFSAVKGKNSCDISLIINAMIVLYEKDIDVYCLASSDSDFTRLVQELREREKTVIGFGLKQTAQAFVNAFSEFIYLDSESKEKTEATGGKKSEEKPAEKPAFLLEEGRLEALKDIIDTLIEDDGRALYARISLEMKNKFSDFVPKNYGCRSLKELMKKIIEHIGCYSIRTDADGTTMFLTADEHGNRSGKDNRERDTKHEHERKAVRTADGNSHSPDMKHGSEKSGVKKQTKSRHSGNPGPKKNTGGKKTPSEGK